jgi:hypothetical protein
MCHVQTSILDQSPVGVQVLLVGKEAEPCLTAVEVSGATFETLKEDTPKVRGSQIRVSSQGGIAMHRRFVTAAAALIAAATLLVPAPAMAADKPNIVLIVSDDTGYGDLGPYGGAEGRGMPTPNIDRLADEGMTFFDFYAQPSCTPGRAAIQTGRIPNRSGMTTVAFQGQGGGLPAAEWTLASVLKTAGYQTFFTGKWHLGEAARCPRRRATTR